ncbi:MAG: sigma-70 family RNA polymerase sigma factor, partial [Xanthobacteraceae bacterium]
MSAEQDQRAIWLGRYVLPHESALRGWLRRRAPVGLEVDDIIQETYTRLVAAESVDQIKDPRTYTFQTAKSVILSHIRRAKIVRITAIEHIDDVGVDWVAPEQTVVSCDELARLAEAIAALPEPAGSVFRLRRVHNMSQKEVAAELGLSEGSVEH